VTVVTRSVWLRLCCAAILVAALLGTVRASATEAPTASEMPENASQPAEQLFPAPGERRPRRGTGLSRTRRACRSPRALSDAGGRDHRIHEDVVGRVTGALFEGEGEVLVLPPDRAERSSLALFTGSAVLEERFRFGYIRFMTEPMRVESLSNDGCRCFDFCVSMGRPGPRFGSGGCASPVADLCATASIFGSVP